MCLCYGDRIEMKSKLCRACYLQPVAKAVEYSLPNFLGLNSCVKSTALNKVPLFFLGMHARYFASLSGIQSSLHIVSRGKKSERLGNKHLKSIFICRDHL